MLSREHCKICNGYHAVGLMHGDISLRLAIKAANIDSHTISAELPRERLTAQQAMERTKQRYKKTLAYLA